MIDLVLADSLYGEASSFIRTLDELKLPWIVAIRSNHGVWLPPHQRVRANKWYKFQRVFSNQTSQTRYIREIIFGKRSSRSYWEITLEERNSARKFYGFRDDQSSREHQEEFRKSLWVENLD